MIKSQPISILIDRGASMSYVSPRIVELCKLVLENFDKSWLVQLATSTKGKVTKYVKDYHIRKKKCNNVHGIQELVAVGHMVRSMPKISVALENRQ